MRARPRCFKLVAAALVAMTLGLRTGDSGIPGFGGAAGWINSPALDARNLRGKVVLVDFWEYTCINCLRTLPYLRTWYERYRDDGFIIVGVHTPEFGFSGERKNVEDATRRLEVTWPVVLDTTSGIWQRYNNGGWPTEYLFDQSGRLVETFSGEGNYEQTEAKIQALLKAHDPKLTLPRVMPLLAQDSYTRAGAMCYLHTPEVLIEHTKIANPGPVGNPKRDALYTDATPSHVDGAVYLQGLWHRTDQAVVSADGTGHLTMRYHAVQVVGVLDGTKGQPIRVDVTQDGAPVAKGDAGRDLRYDPNGMSYVTIDGPRAYELIMNAKMARHDLRLAAKTAGLGVYSFAFEACEVPHA